MRKVNSKKFVAGKVYCTIAESVLREEDKMSDREIRYLMRTRDIREIEKFAKVKDYLEIIISSLEESLLILGHPFNIRDDIMHRLRHSKEFRRMSVEVFLDNSITEEKKCEAAIKATEAYYDLWRADQEFQKPFKELKFTEFLEFYHIVEEVLFYLHLRPEYMTLKHVFESK